MSCNPTFDTHSADSVLEILHKQLQINQILNDRLEAVEAQLGYNSVEPEEGA